MLPCRITLGVTCNAFPCRPILLSILQAKPAGSFSFGSSAPAFGAASQVCVSPAVACCIPHGPCGPSMRHQVCTVEPHNCVYGWQRFAQQQQSVLSCHVPKQRFALASNKRRSVDCCGGWLPCHQPQISATNCMLTLGSGYLLLCSRHSALRNLEQPLAPLAAAARPPLGQQPARPRLGQPQALPRLAALAAHQRAPRRLVLPRPARQRLARQAPQGLARLVLPLGPRPAAVHSGLLHPQQRHHQGSL